MRTKYFIILTGIILISSMNLSGQDMIQKSTSLKKGKSIEFFYQYGKVLKTNDFVRGDNFFNDPIDEFQSFSLRYKWHTNGQKLWQQLYNFPEYGVGVYSANFDHSPELGHPIAIYGFFTAPVYADHKLSLSCDAGFGVTFNWESFELGQNPKNIAIGAEESVYIDLGFKLEYQLYKRWHLGTGVSFTHFSNGALKKPNSGINTFAPKILLAYDINPEKEPTTQKTIPEFKDKNSLSISAYTGWKNVLYEGEGVDSTTANKGVYYKVYGLSTVLNRQINYKSKFGIGFTLGYLGAANSSITPINGRLEDNDASIKEGFEISIYPSYELVINKLSLILQPGFYIHRFKYENQTPVLYQRIGLKYHIWKNVFTGINLHAYSYYISDYIEWNLGYTL